MSTTSVSRRGQVQREGIQVVVGMAAVMWVLEVINTLDSNNLNTEGGIHPRSISHLWEIITAPFLHASFAHLIGNTIPFLVMGLIIALRGALRVAAVTAIVILIGGLGTWLIAPANSTTFGASGIVFGYAAYLLARGIFNRSAFELLSGAIVAVLFGGALLASLVPHPGISWQGHLCGAIAGVIAAYLLSNDRTAATRGGGRGSGNALDRVLAS